MSRRAVLRAFSAAVGAAAVGIGVSAPAAEAAYRPYCVTLLDAAPKGPGVVGRVKFACPPTGASQWRFELNLISTPDCDWAVLPGTGQGGPWAQSDRLPINTLFETSIAGKVGRTNYWETCLTVYEMNSNMQWRQIAHECVGMPLTTYPSNK